jgi:hypothetical protein
VACDIQIERTGMKNLTKTLAAAAIVAGAVLAGPVAANAATYVPNTTDTAKVTAVPGGSFTLTFHSAVFTPSAPLTAKFTSTGPVPTAATTATFLAATAGPVAVGNANAEGGATLTGTVPAAATADITVTLSDGTHTGVGTIDVVDAAGAGSSNLATTGTYISVATVWGAIGLVALGGGLVAVRAANRRKGAGAAHSA